MSDHVEVIRCGNDGCGREAAPGERFCEACGLEWTLFRRDTRPETMAPWGAGSAEVLPGAPILLAGLDSVRLR